MATYSLDSLRSVGIPLCTLVLLVALYAVGGISQGPPAGAQEYFDQVASQIDSLPYRIDGWFGINLPFTDVEVQMLRPNRILQRTYQNETTGQKTILSIVHCTDMRDMAGHYPPVCYPAHGWDFDSAKPMEITIGGRLQEARVYQFSRLNQGMREAIRIVSFFIVPYSDRIIYDKETLGLAAKNPHAAGLGVAQVQILTPGSQSEESADQMVSKILAVVQPVIDTIEAGIK